MAEVERAAASLFADSPYPQLVDAPLMSGEINLQTDGVWVAEDPEGAVVAFVATRVVDDNLHVCEVDVDPDYGRRGLGGRLVNHAAEWARARGLRSLTLTTFSDVPWNGPYYERLGFRVVEPRELPPRLRELVENEGADVPTATRVCMRRWLSSADSSCVRWP